MPARSEHNITNKGSPREHESHNGLQSVSRMFHRQNLRSLSLATVSELTKAQIANYVNQYINGNASNELGINAAPLHMTHHNQGGMGYSHTNHRSSIGHASH